MRRDHPRSTARPTGGAPGSSPWSRAGTSTPSTRWPASPTTSSTSPGPSRPGDGRRARRVRAVLLGGPRRPAARPTRSWPPSRRRCASAASPRTASPASSAPCAPTSPDTRYETWGDLLGYMDGSAAVIGEMMLPVLRPGTDAVAPARSLGLAFQLTNFLRDVGEDLDRGRVYVPQEDLRRFGADPHARVVTPGVARPHGLRDRAQPAALPRGRRRHPRPAGGVATLRRDRPRALRPHPRAHRGRRLRRVRLAGAGSDPAQGGAGGADGHGPRADAARARRPRRPRPSRRLLGERRPGRAPRRRRGPPSARRRSRRSTTTTPRCTWPSPATSSTPPGGCSSRPGPRASRASPASSPTRCAGTPGPGRTSRRPCGAGPAASSASTCATCGSCCPTSGYRAADERPRRARAVPGVRRLRGRRRHSRPTRRRSTRAEWVPWAEFSRRGARGPPHASRRGAPSRCRCSPALGPDPRAWPAGPRAELPPAAALGPDAEAA